ncbi:hypothetical protein RSAG8_01256, partial [Rhizoctonia solani AG-8 WAC10335]
MSVSLDLLVMFSLFGMRAYCFKSSPRLYREAQAPWRLVSSWITCIDATPSAYAQRASHACARLDAHDIQSENSRGLLDH